MIQQSFDVMMLVHDPVALEFMTTRPTSVLWEAYIQQHPILHIEFEVADVPELLQTSKPRSWQ